MVYGGYAEDCGMIDAFSEVDVEPARCMHLCVQGEVDTITISVIAYFGINVHCQCLCFLFSSGTYFQDHNSISGPALNGPPTDTGWHRQRREHPALASAKHQTLRIHPHP